MADIHQLGVGGNLTLCRPSRLSVPEWKGGRRPRDSTAGGRSDGADVYLN